jgi:hypothetical protein
MANTSYVRDPSGEITHIRETSEDGGTSWLYEVSNSIWGGKGGCVEVAEHHEDGTTDAYEYDGGIIGSLFGGGKGGHK